MRSRFESVVTLPTDDRVVGEERLLTDRDARIRDVVQAPDGAIYLLTDDDEAAMLRLTPDSR